MAVAKKAILIKVANKVDNRINPKIYWLKPQRADVRPIVNSKVIVDKR